MAREWTTREDAVLRSFAAEGAAYVAESLERSVASVKGRARRIGVSLRRKGSRRGLVLGQPRTMRLTELRRSDEIHALIASGRIDMTVVSERMRLDARGELPVCPSCGKRPVTNRRTGLCQVCHKELLTQHLTDELANWNAQREQWRAQQAVSRARKEVRRHGEDA